ncbi:MAG: hypothetical protein JOY80_04930, partial [Candidatus Dormibacteraeota bacterium]|nr:hypothetical protein [Candidatus Dormibacteraeota bacterium]
MRVLRLLKVFQTRRKHALAGVGLFLCMVAVPAGVAANGTNVTSPSPSASASPSASSSPSAASSPSATSAPAPLSVNTPSATHSAANAPAANNNANCPVSLPALSTDILTGFSGNSDPFNDAEAATTDSITLPSGFVGASGPSATTGSLLTPVPASGFSVGFFDETELHEFTASYLSNKVNNTNQNNSPHYPAIGDANATGSVTNGTGALTHAGGGSDAYGPGQPYAAIFDPANLSKPLIGFIPTQVQFQNYTPTTAGNHGGPNPTSLQQCGNGPLYDIVGFDVTPYASVLQANKTYEAYILMADTDDSGPLADHAWFFTFAPSNPTGNLFTNIEDCSGNPVNGGSINSASLISQLNGTTSDYNSPTGFTSGQFPVGTAFTLTATAPSGYSFNCPSHVGQNSQSGTIPNGTASVIFFVQKNPPGPTPCTITKTATPTNGTSVPIGTTITYLVTMTSGANGAGTCSATDTLTTDSAATTFNANQPTVSTNANSDPTTISPTSPACTTNCTNDAWTLTAGLGANDTVVFQTVIKVTGATATGGALSNSLSSAALNGTITNTVVPINGS